jgi:hypothetical protein
MIYKHKNSKGQDYFLNTKKANIGGKERDIYYFSKDERETGCEMPTGYTVIENGRTGLPCLKKA